MPLASLVAWFVYLALAFGYRTYTQLRSTGRSGFVGFTRGQTPLERTAGGLFAAALALGLGAPLLALAWPGHPVVRALAATPLLLGLGAALFSLGLGLTLRAQGAMGPSWRIGVDPGERTELVVAGPFRLVRNPIFSAMGLAGAGIVLLCASPLACAAYGLLLAAFALQVRGVEEPYLRRTHGEAYAKYAAEVGRFVPGLGRIRATGDEARTSH